LYAQESVSFDVLPTAIWVDGDERIWGVTQETGKMKNSKGEDVAEVLGAAGVVPNGYKIADLEYFCMGERGDQYRGMGWPNIIPTHYMCNPTKDTEYNILEIHYAFTDDGASSYNSEKDITIAAEDAGVINGIIAAIKAIEPLGNLPIKELA